MRNAAAVLGIIGGVIGMFVGLPVQGDIGLGEVEDGNDLIGREVLDPEKMRSSECHGLSRGVRCAVIGTPQCRDKVYRPAPAA